MLKHPYALARSNAANTYQKDQLCLVMKHSEVHKREEEKCDVGKP